MGWLFELIDETVHEAIEEIGKHKNKMAHAHLAHFHASVNDGLEGFLLELLFGLGEELLGQILDN